MYVIKERETQTSVVANTNFSFNNLSILTSKECSLLSSSL